MAPATTPEAEEASVFFVSCPAHPHRVTEAVAGGFTATTVEVKACDECPAGVASYTVTSSWALAHGLNDDERIRHRDGLLLLG